MAQKTALAELIEDFEEMKKSCNNTYTKIVYDVFLNKAKSKLPKERQDLIDANTSGRSEAIKERYTDRKLHIPVRSESAEQYVQEKFGI